MWSAPSKEACSWTLNRRGGLNCSMKLIVHSGGKWCKWNNWSQTAAKCCPENFLAASQGKLYPTFFTSHSKGMGTKRDRAKDDWRKMPLASCEETQSPHSYLCRLVGGGLTGCESSKSCATISSTGLSKGLYSGG